MIYAVLIKSLYGKLVARLVFWKDLTKKLSRWGSELNSYDACIVNKIVGGKQYTVLWHIGDIKISCFYAKVVDSVLGLLR